MSSASGRVLFSDGLVLHYEYGGTSDYCVSNLKDTNKEVWDSLHKHAHLTCDCGKDEDVVLANDYGGGAYWHGKACRHCRSITKGAFLEDISNSNDGIPSWFYERKEK